MAWVSSLDSVFAADNRLLADMKRSGIRPIAVWDERGVRVWKAPEVRVTLQSLCN